MKQRFFAVCTLVTSFFLSCGQPVSSAANVLPVGPTNVSVGQTFQVTIQVSGAVDVDTVRMNGSYTADLLEWKGSSPTGVFQNVSPGTYVDQATGIFSFGAFTLSSRANGSTRFAVLTFRAKKAGAAYVQLTTSSKVLSAGEEQIGSVGRLNITVEDSIAPPEQPQLIPKSLPVGEAVFSLFSLSHPDPNAWYMSSEVLLEWRIAGKTVRRTYIGFDQSPEGPAEQIQTDSIANFSASSSGIWYAHLGADFSDRTYKRTDLRVQIDSKVPHTIMPTVDQASIAAGVPNYVRFGTTDDESGISRYDVLIDGTLVTSTRLQLYSLTKIPVGKHVVVVRAFDFASNMSEGTTSFEILPKRLSAPGPQQTLGSDILIILLTFVILIIILITLLILIGRRKQKKTPRVHR